MRYSLFAPGVTDEEFAEGMREEARRTRRLQRVVIVAVLVAGVVLGAAVLFGQSL